MEVGDGVRVLMHRRSGGAPISGLESQGSIQAASGTEAITSAGFGSLKWYLSMPCKISSGTGSAAKVDCCWPPGPPHR